MAKKKSKTKPVEAAVEAVEDFEVYSADEDEEMQLENETLEGEEEDDYEAEARALAQAMREGAL